MMQPGDVYLLRIEQAKASIKALAVPDAVHTRFVCAVLIVGERKGAELRQEISYMLPRRDENATPMLVELFRRLNGERPGAFAQAMAAIASELFPRGVTRA